ncbi:MAG: hypothetical protein RLZZ206_559 [Cyanobacteriota bacterium]|jgi:hypothetical protein
MKLITAMKVISAMNQCNEFRGANQSSESEWRISMANQ